MLYFEIYRDSSYNILSQEEFYSSKIPHTIYSLFYSFEKRNKFKQYINLTRFKELYNVDILSKNKIQQLNATIYGERLFEYNTSSKKIYYLSTFVDLNTFTSLNFKKIINSVNNINTSNINNITISVVEFTNGIEFDIQFKKHSYYYYLVFHHIDIEDLNEIISQINSF